MGSGTPDLRRYRNGIYLYQAMSIKPIDFKTSVAGTDGASQLREHQKTHEQGQAGLLAQNQTKIQEKLETVHNVETPENKVLKKEDEDAEREKGNPDQAKKAADAEEEKPEEKAPPLPDPKGIRGLKIDLKA